MAQIINLTETLNGRRAEEKRVTCEKLAKARKQDEIEGLARDLGATPGAYLVASVIADAREKERAATPSFTPAYCDPANEFQGAKYKATKRLDTAEIAKRMRADIKALNLAKGFKISVTIERFSGGSSIDIRVKCVPDDFRLWSDKAASWHKQYPHADHRMPLSGEEVHSAAYNALMGQLKSSYNRDNSDSMTDYFDVRFYGDAGLHWELRQALTAREVEAARGDYWAEGMA